MGRASAKVLWQEQRMFKSEERELRDTLERGAEAILCAGVGCHVLLPGTFPIQGSNTGLPHCRQILYHLSQQGSPRILEWVTCPSSRGTSQSRDQTQVSCVAGSFFTSWATREDLNITKLDFILREVANCQRVLCGIVGWSILNLKKLLWLLCGE